MRMEADVNLVLFMFDRDCECSPITGSCITITDLLEAGTPLCVECDKEFVLRNTCQILHTTTREAD